MVMTKYTYARNFAAHYAGGVVTVPDQIADDQKTFDRAKTVFTAIRADGRRVRVRLDGDAYGLWTSGTGEMVVKAA